MLTLLGQLLAAYNLWALGVLVLLYIVIKSDITFHYGGNKEP